MRYWSSWRYEWTKTLVGVQSFQRLALQIKCGVPSVSPIYEAWSDAPAASETLPSQQLSLSLSGAASGEGVKSG